MKRNDITNPVTAAAINAVTQTRATPNEKALLTIAIHAGLAAGEGLLDSHRLADVLHARRTAAGVNASWNQTRDYVQHMLREAKHVCRYADGHHYRIHKTERCSPSCDQHRTGHTTRPVGVVCPTCFIRTNAFGECDTCTA